MNTKAKNRNYNPISYCRISYFYYNSISIWSIFLCSTYIELRDQEIHVVEVAARLLGLAIEVFVELAEFLLQIG